MKKEYTLVTVILIFINSILLNVLFTCGDEFWVFANCYKMSIGYKIYIDLNIIQTPLNFIIGSTLFNMLGKNFLIFRIYGILLVSCILLEIYIIFRECNMSKKNSILYLIMIYGILFGVFCGGANYSILIYIFVLLGIILEIKYHLLKTNKWWIQTIIIMLVFLSKQNAGIYYFIGIMILEIVNNKGWKYVFRQIILFIIMIIVFLVILNIYGLLEGFINYTVLGLLEFAEKNVYINTFMLMLNILIPIMASVIYFFIKKYKKIENDKMRILYIIGMMMLFFAYPLFNEYHIKLAVLGILIFIMYIIDQVLLKEFLYSKQCSKVIRYIVSISVILMCIFSIMNFCNWMLTMEKDDWNNPYFGAIFQEETKNEIEAVTNYIKEKESEEIKVYVFSIKASLFNIPLGICNGEIDLPMTGNFGKNGEEGMIEKIKLLEKGQILVDKEFDNNPQKPLKVREWIEKNLEKQGEIESFIIYNTIR